MFRVDAIALLPILIATQCATTFAQEPEMNLFYTLKLIEFRPTPSMTETPTSPAKIVGVFRQLEELQELDVIQTLRLSTVENSQGKIELETQPIAQSNANRSDDAKAAKARQPAITTRVQVRFAKKDDRILIDLDFFSTRLSEVGNENPRLIRTNLQSTLVLEPGQPTFVGGGHGEDATFLIAVLESQ